MTRSASTPDSLDVKAAIIDGVITIVVIHDNTQLAELASRTRWLGLLR